MTQEQAVQLLQKYLEGKTSIQETALVEQWYGSLPDRQLLSYERKLAIAANMQKHIQEAIAVKTNRNVYFFNSQWTRIAALLLVVFSFGLFFSKVSLKESPDQIKNIIVRTNSHERKKVSLPDGSTVTLEPMSKITYPSIFSPKQRTVSLLNGDAFFDVVHEEKRQFRVCLKAGFMVRVLGTSFRVRDGINERQLKITVATGKVAVEEGTKRIGTLVKGQELTFNKSSGQASIYAAAQIKLVKLSFEGASLAEVIRKMEYVYAIRIQVDQQKLLNLSTSAVFNSGQKPAEILDIICRIHHLHFSQSKDQKTFKIYR